MIKEKQKYFLINAQRIGKKTYSEMSSFWIYLLREGKVLHKVCWLGGGLKLNEVI